LKKREAKHVLSNVTLLLRISENLQIVDFLEEKHLTKQKDMSVYKVTLNESEIYLLEEAIYRMMSDLDTEEEVYETDLTETKLDYKKILKRFSEKEKIK
jgi:hypothetical protein